MAEVLEDMAMAVPVGDMVEDQAGITVMGVPAGATAVLVGVTEDQAGAMAVLATGGKLDNEIKRNTFPALPGRCYTYFWFKKEGWQQCQPSFELLLNRFL